MHLLSHIVPFLLFLCQFTRDTIIYNLFQDLLSNIEEVECLLDLPNLDEGEGSEGVGGENVVVVPWLLTGQIAANSLGLMQTCERKLLLGVGSVVNQRAEQKVCDLLLPVD